MSATIISMKRMLESIARALLREVNLNTLMKDTTTQVPIISEDIQFLDVNHHDIIMPVPTNNDTISMGRTTQKTGLLRNVDLSSHKT